MIPNYRVFRLNHVKIKMAFALELLEPYNSKCHFFGETKLYVIWLYTVSVLFSFEIGLTENAPCTLQPGNRAGSGPKFICFTMYRHSTKLSDKLQYKTPNKLYDNCWHNCKLNFDFIKFNLAYLKKPYYKILDLINSYIA